MTAKNTHIRFEARLKKNINRTTAYGVNKTYKKGTVLWFCSERIFKKLTSKNIGNYVDFNICEGHGVYEYFSLSDIQFFKVQKVTTTKEYKAKIK